MKLRGQMVLGPNRLRKLSLRKPPRLYRLDEEHEEGEPHAQPACVPAGTCLVTLGGEADPFTTTPKPTDTPFVVSGGGDPQVAAGKSFLVVTAYNKLWVYTKDGKLVTKDKYGSALSYPMTAAQLFTPLWDPPGSNSKGINGYLKLPVGSAVQRGGPVRDRDLLPQRLVRHARHLRRLPRPLLGHRDRTQSELEGPQRHARNHIARRTKMRSRCRRPPTRATASTSTGGTP